MKKMMIGVGAAVVSLSLAALGYAVQGQTDTGGPPTDPSTMGTDRGAQHDTDTTTKQQKKKRKSSSESSLGMDKDQKAEKGSKSGKAPAVPAEGSNPSLDKTGKGSAPGG